MPGSALDPAPPTTNASSGRSFLSRLTSPFAPKARTVSEFYIRPDEPHRRYSPGDVISGAVVLTVVKPIRVTHLIVCLHGFVKVFRNPGDGAGSDGGFLGVGRGKRGGEYFGNGFASLFEDEITLCGDGRLEAGVYEFRFDMEFPGKGLPTSIDFERGTISYKITATLTRPTTISPVTSCDRKFNLVQVTDIATLPAPKPRVISLEPVSKRSKSKANLRKNAALEDRRKHSNSPGLERSTSLETRTQGSRPEEPPRSPTSSEMSSESAISNSTRSFRLGPVLPSERSGKSSSTTSFADKTITATVELLKAGCLPGDSIPLQVSISHTKPIKSLQGVIVTFYRQGRIDFQPGIPIGPQGKSGKEKANNEEIYPKSKVGLGGLSLSAAGSSSMFRKDLSQSFAPLMIDPRSLTAVIKTSVKVPDDVFPTISNVPGAMISFKYYVEVVLDLGGKLAGSDRFLPRLGMLTMMPSISKVPTMPGNGEEGANTAWSGAVVDTVAIRREKSVAACLFEMVVGTKDSDRFRRRAYDNAQSRTQSYSDGDGEVHSIGVDDHNYYDDYDTNDDQTWAYGYDSSQQGQDYGGEHTGPYGYQNVPEPVPPAAFPDDEGDEKTRMRRAEERLLPSQPPLLDGEDGSFHTSSNEPSAPDVVDGYDLYSGPSNYYAPNYAEPSAPSTDTIVPMSDSDVPPGSRDTARETDHQRDGIPMDDKHELERRRLETEASAPEGLYDGDANESGERDEPTVPYEPAEPTAPALDEDDSYAYALDHGSSLQDHAVVRAQQTTGESLPRYER